MGHGESSDKTWSTGEGNGKPLQYSCLENPINSMKRRDFVSRLIGDMYMFLLLMKLHLTEFESMFNSIK